MPLIAGIDEVGRGCLAGPLMAVAALFRYELWTRGPIEGVKDSKKFSSHEDRVVVFNKILISPVLVDVGLGVAEVEEIDKKGIDWANKQAFIRAVQDLKEKPDQLIVDGVNGVQGFIGKQQVEPKADGTYWEVGAASILAKVIRDRLMMELHTQFPGYDWVNNMGYGTPKHIAGLRLHGPTYHHRKKFTTSAMEKR